MVTDKLIMYSLFSMFDLPHPKVRAIACTSPRSCGDIPVFSNLISLARFIRESIKYPFFCKAIKGSFGRGSTRIEGYEKGTDTLVTSDGSSVPVMEYLYSLEDQNGFGVLFQDAVVAHPDTIPLFGNVVSGCRVIMLLDENGAYPYKIIWKIPVGSNHVDNFVHGKLGNMIAAVDVRTGAITRVVSGKGILNFKLNQPHPDTKRDLIGIQLPDWSGLIETIKRAAESFPEFHWQHWDVGITSTGPILFELNSSGNHDSTQISHGTGIYDGQLRAFVKKIEGVRTKSGKVFLR